MRDVCVKESLRIRKRVCVWVMNAFTKYDVREDMWLTTEIGYL